MEDKEYKFSVIIPIYNTEDYLNETIDSIINQSIGFKDNIQLILINDGSTDSCENICLEYQKKFPQNIVYEYKENGGVSSAMNAGRKHIKGKYVNFFGSDDIWDKDAFLYVDKFVKKNGELSLLSCKIQHFGITDSEHALNYKYKQGSRVTDVLENPEDVQLTGGNCFYFYEVLKDIFYDEECNYAEDVVLNASIFLKDSKYGLVADAVAMYRKRAGSLTKVCFENKERYVKSYETVLKKIMQLSKKEKGEVLPFIQYTVMYEMQWRMKEVLPKSLTEEEFKNYCKNIREILLDIDDEIIFMQHSIGLIVKCCILKLKHSDDYYTKLGWTKNMILNEKGYNVFPSRNRKLLQISKICVELNSVVIEGNEFYGVLNIPYKICAVDNEKKKYYAELSADSEKDIVFFDGKKYFSGSKFVLEIPKKIDEYELKVEFGDGKKIKIRPFFYKESKLNHKCEGSYFASGKHIIAFCSEKICIMKNKLLIKLKLRRN